MCRRGRVRGLIEGRTYGWWGVEQRPEVGDWTWPFKISPIPFAFALAVVGLIAFIAWGVHRERGGRSTLLALRLFSITSFRNGNIAAAVVSLGEFGVILALPLWLQFVIGFDALQTGLLLLPLADGSSLASGIAGATSGRIAPVWIVRIGLLAEVVGVAGVGLAIGPDASWIPLIPLLFVYGVGVGLATAQLTGVVLADVPVADSGAGERRKSPDRSRPALRRRAAHGVIPTADVY